MIIHPVQMESSAGGVRLSVRLQSEARPKSEDLLWFDFPGASPEQFSGAADGFVVAVLLLAMARGEAIDIDEPLDRRLLANLIEYQRVFHAWFPDRFHFVGIRCRGVRAGDPQRRAVGVASPFSGGVDSSYTVWSHLAENEPDPARRITHALFVHGFDIPLADVRTFEAAAGRYAREMRALGIELILARTNIRDVLDELPWELAHGSALGAVALLLDRMLGIFYLPASFSYDELDPWGSHPVPDPLMSSDTLNVIHDGCMVRSEKIAKLSHWAPARSWLRVCWERPDATANCCRCYKCTLTMVALELAGMLDQCPTFPAGLEGARIRRVYMPPQEWREAQTLIRRAVESGRADVARDLRAALWRSRLRARMAPAKRILNAISRRLWRGGRPKGGPMAKVPAGPEQE
jgi:hypothetical protein